MDGYIPSYGFGYGAWAQVMAQWEQLGVFTVLLPFVLIFAVVYAILERIELFKNRGVHMLIALVVGFFTISNPAVSYFFMYLFGNLAWGIGILIAVVILIGLAIKPDTAEWRNIFIFLGIAIFLAILAKPTPLGTSGLQFIVGDGLWYWVQNNTAIVVLGLVIVAVLFAVVRAGKGEEKEMKIPVR